VLNCGLHLLRLPPREFWALTPIEFSIMAYGIRSHSDGLPKDALLRLSQLFPDEPT
jgi:uncharacterized phage protein (TIGR02216 family)